jgi:hypothetical protein
METMDPLQQPVKRAAKHLAYHMAKSTPTNGLTRARQSVSQMVRQLTHPVQATPGARLLSNACQHHRQGDCPHGTDLVESS